MSLMPAASPAAARLSAAAGPGVSAAPRHDAARSVACRAHAPAAAAEGGGMRKRIATVEVEMRPYGPRSRAKEAEIAIYGATAPDPFCPLNALPLLSISTGCATVEICLTADECDDLIAALQFVAASVRAKEATA